MDVTNEEDVHPSRSNFAVAFGGLDIVVFQRGNCLFGTTEETSLALELKNQSIYQTGYFLVARKRLLCLNSKNGGNMVFIAK